MSFDRGSLRVDVKGTLALFSLYVLFGKLGLTLDAVSGFATLVWPPTGLALAALLLGGYRLWPGVWLGAFVVNVWTGAPLTVALGIASGNTLEALLGAYAICRLTGFQGSFDRLRHVVGLIVPASTISTLVGATIGVSSLALGGLISRDQFAVTWRDWWIGDALGGLVVAPFLLAWATAGDFTRKPFRTAEAALLGALLIGASVVVFIRTPATAMYPFEVPYVLFPLFIWGAVRFELRGAATATALVSVFAVWGAERGTGPFVGQSLADRLLALQTFMGYAACIPLLVAGAISDRGRAIRTRETFIASVSHDLKNPMNAIQMSAAVLARALPPELCKGRAQKHDELVRRSVERMTRLVGDLLDASAIDAGRMSVEPRDESVRALVREAVELLRPLAAGKNQDLRLGVVEDLQVMCDRARVLQVLSNLVGNAIKFSDEGRTIKLRVERESGVALFSVEDHGVGIDPGQLRHVFERHWHTRTTSGGGSGLGLFLAKGIIEAHGGRLWAKSKVGVGTRFYFTLLLSSRSPSRKAAKVQVGGPTISTCSSHPPMRPQSRGSTGSLSSASTANTHS